ncbi:Mpv17/PMP22 [Moelleriella libera RCEF 2490]|uniref:Mpv17/PMP22 n=1 Tax=Moelleriella libera RCEF 2490 TaxID=1081109 RepID=A0A168ETH2_9HYPO|nr:Mpv17/PMP22 [Moelleriella libera RCEF 2490]
MARSPIVSATLQAAVLGAASNILAQVIEAYRKKSAIEVNWIPVFQFLIFSVISTPPNFLWQDFLESTFPARVASPSPPSSSSSGSKVSRPDQSQPQLSTRNTLIKFALDQTVGAVFNTLLFSIYIHSIHMAMPNAPRITSFTKATGYWLSPGVIDFSAVDLGAVLDAAFAEFWTIVFAGVKLWPAVSLVNFTLVKTVEGRNLVGCIAGLGWGVYMSMIAAKD